MILLIGVTIIYTGEAKHLVVGEKKYFIGAPFILLGLYSLYLGLKKPSK